MCTGCQVAIGVVAEAAADHCALRCCTACSWQNVALLDGCDAGGGIPGEIEQVGVGELPCRVVVTQFGELRGIAG